MLAPTIRCNVFCLLCAAASARLVLLGAALNIDIRSSGHGVETRGAVRARIVAGRFSVVRAVGGIDLSRDRLRNSRFESCLT